MNPSVSKYKVVTITDTMAAGLAGDSPVLSFRWGSEVARACLRSVKVSMMSLAAGFTAGSGKFEAIFARAFTASDTGGGALDFATNPSIGKTLASQPTTLVTDYRTATTDTLSAGTRTADAQPFGALQFGVTTGTNTVHLATSTLFEGEKMLVHDEGFVVQATVPATGTWRGIFVVEWDEAALGHAWM